MGTRFRIENHEQYIGLLSIFRRWMEDARYNAYGNMLDSFTYRNAPRDVHGAALIGTMIKDYERDSPNPQLLPDENIWIENFYNEEKVPC
jgi:hypothetical protein